MSDKAMLSPREQEILKWTAKGLSNREIAQALHISPNTVKVHLSNIFEKTGVASRTEAAFYGMELGIVEAPVGEASQPLDTPSLRDTLLQFRWVWVAVGLLIVLVAVTLTAYVILPAPIPEPILQDETANLAARWQALAPMPAPRAAMAAVAYDEMIYTIAGEGNGGVRGEVFRYVPEADYWEQLADKPVPVAEVEGVVIGEKIFVPGGRLADGQVTDALEIYDPRQDSWSQGAPMPKAVSAYALAGFEGKLYLFGGWDGTQDLADVFVYDPVANIWRAGTPMVMARRDAEAVVLSEKIMVFGGWNEEGLLSAGAIYYPTRDNNQEIPWEKSIGVDNEFQNGSLGVQSFGGFLVSIFPTDRQTLAVFYYYPQYENWKMADEISPNYLSKNAASTQLQGYFYLLGGVTENETLTASAVRYLAMYTVTFPIITQ